MNDLTMRMAAWIEATRVSLDERVQDETGASSVEYVAAAAVIVTLLGVVAAGFAGDTSLGTEVINRLRIFITNLELS